MSTEECANCGSLKNRVEALHEYKLRQIDENRKISIRMDEFEKLAKFNMSSEVQELLIFNLKMINERLENLENPENDKSHHVLKTHERIDYVLVRLSKLEKFHDEFKDVLRKDILVHRKMWDEVHERLDRLEQSSEARARSNKEIFERLQEIERFQDITHLEYQNRNKKPHKCPVCDGMTKYHEIVLDGVLFKNVIPCISCERGIVWS